MTSAATTSIRADKLTKIYRVYPRPMDRLVEAVTTLRRHTEVRALDGVTFTIEKGQTVGLVGPNGAGKSTLLKILGGVVTPSSGALHVSGRIASIVELGMGFHPEFTGRANAELNGAILGLDAQRLRETLPRIYEFSELGEFLDRPVRTYSSGMLMRLAFALASHVDADVLLVDEALAVGDGHFQMKCIERMREFLAEGRTVIFCSHSLAAISSLCRRTIWLDGGVVRMAGATSEVIAQYEKVLAERNAEVKSKVAPEPERSSPVRVSSLALRDASGEAASAFPEGSSIVVSIGVRSESPDEPVHVVVGIDRVGDQLQCTSFGTMWDKLPPLRGRTEYRVDLLVNRLSLTASSYTARVLLGDETCLHLFDQRETTFAVTGASGADDGIFLAQHDWDVR